MNPLGAFKKYMIDQTLSFVYIDNPDTIAHLTGFYSNPHERVLALLITADSTQLLVPKLEESEARSYGAVDIVTGYKDEDNPWAILKENVAEDGLFNTIGIESDYLVVDRYHQLMSLFPDASFKSVTSYLQNMKVIKSGEEILIMKEAGHLADEALRVGMDALSTGITEQEVVAVIEYEMKKLGVKEMSFDTMVLFGDHAASPHGTPGDRKLQAGELVLFDLGVVYNGYTSDVTRTVSYGDPSPKLKELYSIVLNAQKTAQAAVRPGITAGELDAAARQIITESGYGDYFTHRLGHGLGRSVHEFPNIAPGVTIPIQTGMCFSIEPGVYIEGTAGIRIEDCLVVTDKGADPFTQTTKELIVIPVKE